MYEAIGVKNINAILPAPAQPTPMDPAMEHIQALGAKPFQAFPGQDHRAHIDAHLNFMQVNMVRNSPVAMGLMQKNILEHIALMAQEQVQLEFQQELLEVQQLQQAAMQDPMIANQIKMTLEKIESRKSQLIAEMTAEFAKEENKITSQFDSDPLLKLKSREVDLRAMENERKAKEAEERINLDKARTMMDQEFKEEKLEQNEKLAKLRAGVSLAKSGAGNTVIGIED
jgi:hypothetical protein